MSSVWVSSDLHFNHKRIIEFCQESRGHCESIDHMNQTIINNFNSVINEEDTLYLLGDIGFGDVGEAIELIKQLKGQKVWIHGNHDRKFWGNYLYHQQKAEMRIVEDTPYKTIWHRVDDTKYQIVMFHFPIQSWENSQRGSIHLHGHLHSNSNQVITHRKMDVGVDTNHLMPYNMDYIVRKLSTMPIPDDYHADS